jgi:hypothetical protein
MHVVGHDNEFVEDDGWKLGGQGIECLSDGFPFTAEGEIVIGTDG